MKQITHFFLLSISIFFFGCKDSTIEKPAAPISDMNTDFPIAEELEFKPFNTYNIIEPGSCVIENSVLWFFPFPTKEIIGSCYDLHTGEKLSTIASIGRAANEVKYSYDQICMVNDSILFYTKQDKTIKSFAQKDIINNVPMGDRKVNITTIPDSILACSITKLPNGSILATIEPNSFEIIPVSEFNQKSIAIINDKETHSYETIDYSSFDLKKATSNEAPAEEIIKYAYAQGWCSTKDNSMAVFSVARQFILYTFDLKNKKVANEKRYTRMKRHKPTSPTIINYMPGNDQNIDITSIQNNEQYILCNVSGYFNEKDKENKQLKEGIFVFDWNLNPIKRFELPKRKNGYYTIPSDCSAVYFYESNEEGLTLYKADLNI